MLEVRLLGQCEVRLTGATVEIPSRPAQSLFAYLILNRGIASRREKLAGLLWPDSSEANARNNLRQALWRLRRALHRNPEADQHFLIADNFAVGFNDQSEFWLDVQELETRIPADGGAEAWIAAVSVYRGELLPGFYEEWVTLERERVEALFEQRMGTLLDRLLAEQRWEDALSWAERWIAAGMVPEPAYRALMLAHTRLGDLSAAASAYTRCVEDLAEKLGVRPSPETVTLYQNLIREDGGVIEDLQSAGIPTSRPASQPEALRRVEILSPPPPAIGRSVFVGRDRELAQLEIFLTRSLAGHGQVVFVTGEPGSGKTALMSEFARRTWEAGEPTIFAFGNCNALTGIGDPYLPFREILTQLAGGARAGWGIAPERGTQAASLEEIFPHALEALLHHGADLVDSFIPGSALLAGLEGLTPARDHLRSELQHFLARHASGGPEARLEQKDLFLQYTRVLHTLAARRPLVLILDDLQWADLGSVSLLFHLGRRIQHSPILLLAAFRPAELALPYSGDSHPVRRIVAEFQRAFGEIQIDLERTYEDERRRFVEDFLDTEPNLLDEAFREELYRHTGGQPLFTIELLRAMEVSGDLVKDPEGRWVRGESLDWGRLPARVEGVIQTRIARVGPEPRELLRVASVEGETFTAEVCARVLGRDEGEVVASLSAILDRRFRLVTAETTQRIDGARLSRYRFRHGLFQKHLYHGLDTVERAYLHERVGAELERLYGLRSDEYCVPLARHFSQSEVAEKASHYQLLAGELAMRLSAHDEAIDHFSMGLEMLSRQEKGPSSRADELRLLSGLGIAMIATRGYAATEVELIYRRAREISRETQEGPMLGPILYGLRSFSLVRADYDNAYRLAGELTDLGRRLEDAGLLLAGHESLGTSLFYKGRLEEARPHLEEARRLYDPARHRPLNHLYGQDNGVTSSCYLGLTLWAMGFPDQGLESAREGLVIGLEARHPFSLGLAHTFNALVHTLRRDHRHALEQSEAAISLAERYDFPFWLAAGRVLRGWSLAFLERTAEGIKVLREGVGGWERMGTRLGKPMFLSLLGEALGKAGLIKEGLFAVQQGLLIVESRAEPFSEPELYRIQGELLLATGAEEREAEQSLEQALHLARQHKLRSLELRSALSLGRLWARRGAMESAIGVLRPALEAFEEGHETGDLMEAASLLESWSAAQD